MRKLDVGFIPEYEQFKGRYVIYDDGQVWSTSKQIFLKQRLTKKGYHIVDFWMPGMKTPKHVKVSRLVALAFIPNPDPEHLPQVGHDDEDKDNNHWSNLYWTDALENNNHGSRSERVAKSKCKPVLCVELNKVFNSLTEAALEFNLSVGNISNCCRGKGKTAGGYHWELVKEN